MARSMTAYARAKSAEISGLSWTVEIHTVNRKMLDIHMQLGRELLFLDLEFRKVIAEKIHRGQVSVKIFLAKNKKSTTSLPLLKKLKTEFHKIAKELQLSTKEITLPFLINQFEHLSLEEELGPKVPTELKKTLKHALADLIKMKEAEGKTLVADLLKRIKTLSTYVKAMEKESEKSPENYRQKLVDKLGQIFPEAQGDERILKEIALFAEKVDITEEIIRMKSHLEQISDLLKSKEESIGRTLDFIIQEMLREVNTIASKTDLLTVTKRTISSKAELEKIREQVQNIE